MDVRASQVSARLTGFVGREDETSAVMASTVKKKMTKCSRNNRQGFLYGALNLRAELGVFLSVSERPKSSHTTTMVILRDDLNRI